MTIRDVGTASRADPSAQGGGQAADHLPGHRDLAVDILSIFERTFIHHKERCLGAAGREDT